MKNIIRTICLYSLAMVLFVAMSSCNSGGGGTNIAGFFIATTITVNGLTMPEADPVPVSGATEDACQIINSGVTSFSAIVVEFSEVANASVGCVWSFERGLSSQCPVVSFSSGFVNNGSSVGLPCGALINTFTADPSDIDLSAGPPPATINITGTGMDPTYATPIVRFYDQNQTVWLQVNAVGSSPDGTWLQVPSSQIGFPGGSYAAVVYVMRADGTWNAVGGAPITVFNPPPPPPDPCADPNAPKGGDCFLPID